MTDNEIIALIWALVGAVAALASIGVAWPTSVAFCVLGVVALVMAVRTERW
jgi:hypothetical protein